MSINVSHVESPKADASAGQLNGLEYQALASVQTAQQGVAQAQDIQSKAAGAEVEAKREAAGAECTPNAEGDLLINTISQTLGGGAELVSSACEILSDRASDPAAQVDTASVAKKTGGMVASGKTTSFEQMFKDMKKGPSVVERTGLASSSVGGQKDTGVPASLSKESVGAMQQTAQVTMSLGIANEKVLGQIQAVRATPQAPTMGGPAMSMASGPSFNKKQYEDNNSGNGDETWMGGTA